MPTGKRALHSLLALFACLLACAGLASPARAATFPCSIGPSDIAGLTFTNAGDGSFQLGGVLTSTNITATTGGCNSLPNASIRPLVGATPTATLNLEVTNATTQGGSLMRTAAGEVQYKPPSPSFSGTDTFTIDNNNNTRVINVTVVVLAATDTTPPAAPVILTPANGATTGDSTSAVTGTAEVSSTVRVYFDGSQAGTTTADGSGNWAFTPGTTLSDGAHNVYATATDAANNTSSNSATNSFTVDTTPPAAPVVLTPANGSTTSNATPAVTGTAEPASTVTVTLDGSSGTTTADGSGNWTFTPGTPLSDGAHNVYATAADSTGNASTNSNTNNFTVTPLPTASNSSATVAHGSANNAIALTLGGGAATSVTVVTQATNGIATATGTSISYTPNAGYAGSDSFTYRASNAAGDSGIATVTITITVPTISVSPSTLTAPAYGTPYSATITASGGYPAYSFAVTAGALPTGLSLASDGTLSGTPGAAGSFNFTVTATDSSTGTGPFTGSRAYSVIIGAPTITLSPAAGALPSATAGSAYSQSIGASGGTSPYSYAVTAGALPAGLTLNASSGALTGAPTAGGSFSFTVTATDSSSGGPFSASAAYTLTVGSPTVEITPATLPAAMMAAAYSTTLGASGGTGPYSYAVTSGALPTGLTLSAGGVLSGTPTVHGSFSFTVSATDSSGGTGPYTGARSYTLTVSPPLAPVANGVSATVGYGSSGNIIALDLTGGTATSVAVATPPAHGAATATGLSISYTPAAGYSGPDSFTYTATNDGGTSAPATAAITVGNPAIAVGPASLAAGQQDVAYSAALSASGGAAPYSYAVSAGALPAGLSLNSAGVLSGTPADSGSFAFTVTATDSSTGTGPFSGSTAYALQIALPAPPVAHDAPATSVPGSTTQNAQSVDIDLSALVEGNYTGIQIDTQPEHGTVTIANNGRYIATYRPAAGYQGSDAFTFVAVGPGGSSAPARVAITVVGAVPVASSLSATLLNGGELTLDVTSGASEGPFTNAAIVSVTPSDGVSAELIAGGSADNRSYGLKLKALDRFSGTATVRYTLSNVFGTSQPATVTITVEARPDPSADSVVRGLSAAQAEATRRFASTQLDNFARRNEQLHGGGGASRGQQLGIRLSGGDPVRRNPDEKEDAFDMRSLRGVQMADASEGASPVIGELAAAENDAARSGERPNGSLELWSGGALAIGTRDASSKRSRLRVSSSGLSAGMDLRISQALTLGIGGGYGFERTKVGQDGEGRLDGENWVGALYGSYMPATGMFIDGVAGVGGLEFKTRRQVEANGMTARGRRHGSMVFGSLATGFDWSGDRLRFSAYGRVEYMAANLDAYAETGADIYNLSYARREPESFSSILGARGSIALPAGIGLFTPRGRIEWRHEFNRSGAQALDYADIVGANGLGHAYLIDDESWSRDEVQLEMGLGLEVGSGWNFGVDLGGRIGADTSMGTAKLSASKDF